MKKTTILICMMVALAGCSSDKARDEYVAGAGKGRPLDMPPDLVMPKNDGQYTVPSGSQSSATYSQYAKSGALQGQTCGCATTAAAPAAAKPAPIPHPTLQARAGGGKSIMLAEPFDRCWLRVSQAMDATNIVPEDKNRSKGLFYLKGGSQLTVRGNLPGAAASCEIFVVSANGVSTGPTQKITEALYKALGQQ